MLILLIEQDTGATGSVHRVLSKAKLDCVTCAFIDEAIDTVKMGNYDLILYSEVKSPSDGVRDVSALRSAGLAVPLVVVTRSFSKWALVEYLEHGADDYVALPMKQAELNARLTVIVRRSRGTTSSLVRIGRLEIDVLAKSVCVAGQALPITRKEYEVLEILARQKGEAVSREGLLDLLYDGAEPNGRVIDVFISKLRRKITAATGGENYLITIRGLGYALTADDDLDEYTATPKTLLS